MKTTAPPTALTRPQKEKLIYRHTHRDFKGNGAILVLRPGGTTLVPMTALTDEEIEYKLPYALGKEAAKMEKTAAALALLLPGDIARAERAEARANEERANPPVLA